MCYVSYMVIFICSRRKTKLDYTTSLFDDDKCTHFFYVVVVMPSKMHKFHTVHLWMRIPIVLGSHIVYCLRIVALDGIKNV